MISLERQHELFHATLASINKSARGFQIYLTPPQLAIDCNQTMQIAFSAKIKSSVNEITA